MGKGVSEAAADTSVSRQLHALLRHKTASPVSTRQRSIAQTRHSRCHNDPRRFALPNDFSAYKSVTILQAIYTWSSLLPTWQQDAMARIYFNRDLSNGDLEDLLALAKLEAGIPDPKCRTPRPLDRALIATEADSSRSVRLRAIKGLANVNALAPGGCLPIAENGLTVVYGENGAGKSGYARILKHACRARDQREPVLPDAKLDPSAVGKPTAILEITLNGVAQDLTWVYASPSPEALSEISIFDTHCARAYIDNQGDFAYRPYGLDILESLVAACNQLKAMALREQAENAPSNAAYLALAVPHTKTGRALLSIPNGTTRNDIEELAHLNEPEMSRLAILRATLDEPDPSRKAQAFRQRALRLQELTARVAAANSEVNDSALTALQTKVMDATSAEASAEFATTEFRSTPGQLKGTGSEPWKALFEAARSFAATSHPEHTLDGLEPRSLCPLCQNPLGEHGANRLSRFDAYVKQASVKRAKSSRISADLAIKTIRSAQLDLALGGALTDELKEIDIELANSCFNLQAALLERQSQAISAAYGAAAWDSIPALPEDPCPRLSSHASALLIQAHDMDASADARARAAMTQEFAELDARRRLATVKAAVLENIAKHELSGKLQRCIDALDTRAISRKATELSKSAANQDLADALNEELQRLKVHQLHVVMKPESPGGKTQYKLTLQLPGGSTPSAILSEGEQRAIAIAAFLAEIRLGKGRGGIVFDDPVSSLDHRRRWEVAERLAEESKHRQVIIFTHDIYFLAILEQKAEAANAVFVKNYIRRTADGFGVNESELPFDVVGTKARIGILREMVRSVRDAQVKGDDDQLRAVTTLTYGRLRSAWERCVEEVLLNGVVQRFDEGVATKRLKVVQVTDDDYKRVEQGMTKSSKFEHDAASSVGRLPLPDPAELERDIDALEAFRKEVDKRNRDGIAARK